MTAEHERKLESEMLEAAQNVADVAHVERDPLLIILWRLNHQDKTLESIQANLGTVGKTLNDHIARESSVQESIDDMVSLWKGSKVVGRIMTWVVGIAAAFGAAYATIKRGVS